jgi:hypothetical protein
VVARGFAVEQMREVIISDDKEHASDGSRQLCHSARETLRNRRIPARLAAIVSPSAIT